MDTRRGPGGRATALAALLMVAGLAVACGDQSDGTSTATPTSSGSSPSSPSSSPSAPALATCGDVWQEGQDLPSNYRGCTDDSGAAVKPQTVGCSSGQRLYLYDDHYWAVRGHVISFAKDGLAKDNRYHQVLYSCRA